MNVALSRAMTVDDYLAWGLSQGERRRTELINGRIVAMTPERVEHVEIKFATALALKVAISRAKVACHALGDGLTVRIDDHTAYEPDALVYCGERLARGSLTVPQPGCYRGSVVADDRAHRHERQADRLFQAAERHALFGGRPGCPRRHPSSADPGRGHDGEHGN
jgi:hypothetical protein